MTTLTISKSIKKSIRLTFTAASLAVLASCGSSGRTALTPGVAAESSSATAASTAPTGAPVESATTQTVPPVTVATVATVATEPPTVPVVAAADSTPVAPVETTPATPSLPPPTLATTPATAPPPPVSTDPIAAVDANGDAVLVAGDGSLTLLHNGTGPDDPLPDEGPVEYVSGVAVTNDLGIRIVGTCCEPAPGWLIISSGTVPPIETGSFGHAPVISPDQTQLAAITVDAVIVSRLDLSGPHDISIETAGAQVLDIEWLDDANIVVLVSSPTEAALYRYQITDEGLIATAVVSIPVVAELAGVQDGVVYALGATSTLTAFSTDTFAPVPERDIVLPVVPLSASMHDGELRWIDQDRNLYIGDTLVPGHYLWIA